MPMIGVVYCYLGLAYNLYLMKHNIELQSRLVSRLKDVQQFQGAYYELLVANCLIRAGFKLDLEDEVDKTAKHCEFSALSKTTGSRYWVEAKMRSVPGVLGKTDKDGSTSNDPTSRLTQHLRAALQKPAPDKRMIFIDLNTSGGKFGWLDRAMRRLDDRERDLAEGKEAYVFVTNMAFHRDLDGAPLGGEGYVRGLGISDFGKPSKIRLPDWYRQKQKHIDAHNIVEAFKTYPQIPDTFDGRPASEAFSEAESYRIKIGETFFFEGVGDGGEIGTVTAATVREKERQVLVAVTTQDGKADILKRNMSDVELEDYKKYGDAYFGGKSHKQGELTDVFDLYEWLVTNYSETPKERLLELAHDRPDIEHLRSLDQFNLVLEICAGWATAVAQRRDQP